MCSQSCADNTLHNKSFYPLCPDYNCSKCGNHSARYFVPCIHGSTTTHMHCPHDKITIHDD